MLRFLFSLVENSKCVILNLLRKHIERYVYLMPKSKREDLMDAALELFNRRGFKATGIESILKEAGVAKMTLYKHFQTKEELVLAVLRRQDEVFRNQLFTMAKKNGEDPKEQILGLFLSLHKLIGKKFNGCLFQKASMEYKDDNQAIHRFSREHKMLIKEFIEERLIELGVVDEKLVSKIMILYNGSLAESQMNNCIEPLSLTTELVEQLIDTGVKK
jgi:AcrR family transcriptional regulator